jgi:hypothetical protein
MKLAALRPVIALPRLRALMAYTTAAFKTAVVGSRVWTTQDSWEHTAANHWHTTGYQTDRSTVGCQRTVQCRITVAQRHCEAGI